MSTQIAATKGNLIRLKRALKLSQSGYELMDRKRNILISEMMKQADQVRLVRQACLLPAGTGKPVYRPAGQRAG